ncbi:hypothetical protein R5W23_006414 [Gemmata sp. JC673]|uniref:Lipoprotein n=1 Tax=Gemmata algarum TaxID=2975278 RepID=A0ABU5EZS6_9BACT|nr:hypothetical protein [Gemmata algarum]MDY3559196.1 hypothetical protein [Gemmata algarum]
MTAFSTLPPPRVVRTSPARFAAVLALPLALTGCGAPTVPTGGQPPSSGVGTQDPPWVALRSQLPAPDADRITYDEQTGVLKLYDLPGNDRWMIQMPGEEAGRPSPAQQRIPAGTPLAHVCVYYVRPGMKPSAQISVKQIRETGLAHNSLAALR